MIGQIGGLVVRQQAGAFGSRGGSIEAKHVPRMHGVRCLASGPTGRKSRTLRNHRFLGPSRRRKFCHFADTPFPSILKPLLKGAGVQQNDSLADSCSGQPVPLRTAAPSSMFKCATRRRRSEGVRKQIEGAHARTATVAATVLSSPPRRARAPRHAQPAEGRRERRLQEPGDSLSGPSNTQQRSPLRTRGGLTAAIRAAQLNGAAVPGPPLIPCRYSFPCDARAASAAQLCPGLRWASLGGVLTLSAGTQSGAPSNTPAA